jgi:hypothetical protein
VPKIFKTQKSSRKVLKSAFPYRDGILPVDYLEGEATNTIKYYVALPDKLKQRPFRRKLVPSRQRCPVLLF